MNWILASGSPRRRELLEMLGVPDLTIRPATGPERATPGAGPEQTVRELSLHKAQEVAQTCAPEDIIIAADTIVYLDGAILGKPKDHDDAVRMLTALSGREHIVYTGVAVLRGGELRQAARELKDEEDRRLLRRRITELTPLLQETRELAALTAHYYDRSYHRHERYTL